MFLSFAVFLAIWPIVDFASDRPVDVPSLLFTLLGIGSVMTLFVCLMFIPRELEYDADWFQCSPPFRRPCSYVWKNLEAFGWGEGVFLLKLRSRDALLISGCAFRRREWRAFLKMLRSEHPEKKCSHWINVTPVRRKPDDE